ncbi:MAG TPA: BBE domain-containing protein [Natrialbaceae archaeon]|nr:BBE domain-containing protein [Natrialbaceae archaeon]
MIDGGHRDARFVYGAAGMWDPENSNGEQYREWVRDAWEQFRHFSAGGNYVNFQTDDEDKTRIRATYADNFDRLVDVKTTYDPDNLFRVNRNVRPA